MKKIIVVIFSWIFLFQITNIFPVEMLPEFVLGISDGVSILLNVLTRTSGAGEVEYSQFLGIHYDYTAGAVIGIAILFWFGRVIVKELEKLSKPTDILEEDES